MRRKTAPEPSLWVCSSGGISDKIPDRPLGQLSHRRALHAAALGRDAAGSRTEGTNNLSRPGDHSGTFDGVATVPQLRAEHSGQHDGPSLPEATVRFVD